MNGATIFYAIQTLALATGFNFPAEDQNADYCSSEDGIRALEWDTTCTRYFQCVDGLWTVKSCQVGTVIDLTTSQCTNPDDIEEWERPECKEHAMKALEEQLRLKEEKLETSPEADNTAFDGKNPYVCIGHDPHTPIAHRDCNKYRQCVNGFWHTRECGPDTVFDVSKLTCAHKDQAWGCGLEAENNYKKKVEEWIALAKEKEAEKEEKKNEDIDDGPVQPTIFANFRGLGGTHGDGQAYEYPLEGEFGGNDEEVVLTDPSEFVPREGSPCHGPGLFPVTGKCGVYLQCAPDSLLMLRHCPFQTYFEPAKSKCDYKEYLVRTDCILGEEAEQDDLSGLPSATLLEKLVAKNREL